MKQKKKEKGKNVILEIYFGVFKHYLVPVTRKVLNTVQSEYLYLQ